MQKLLLSIPQPCHEAWDAMTPTDKGKFCASCAKEVIDFSAMTDTQLMGYFAKLQTANVCGRVHGDQLNRTLSSLPAPRKKMLNYWQYLLGFFLFVGKGQQGRAQGLAFKPGDLAKTENLQKEEPKEVVVVGGFITSRPVTKPVKHTPIKSIRIMDSEGTSLAFATCRFFPSGTTLTADSSGMLDMHTESNAESILVSAVGCEEKSLKLKYINSEIFVLARITTTLDDVRMMSGYERRSGFSGRMGGLSVRYVTNYTVYDSLKHFLFNPQLNVFPNPVQKGGTVNVQMPVKKAGPFVLQVIDAAGKVLLQQDVDDKTLVAAVNIPATWAAGGYFIRVLNNKRKLTGTGKLIVVL
jgi:hypothetical protein